MSQLTPFKRRKHLDSAEPTSTSPQDDPIKSAWDYYNEKARIEDIELVKDWYETLSNLLIFAALFSAILTAFVIESLKLLQEDTQESTRDILLFMTMQAVNASLPNVTVLPYTNDPFHLEGYVIAMNCMFFASLSLSLLAALASIIILQWVGKYDAGIMSFPTANERALHRQFRFDGVRTWRMEDMIGALPYLLYFSLIFFFIGAITWLSHLNTIVMAVVITFFLVGILVYVATTILAVKFPSAPYRTPLSDYLTSFLFMNPRNRENDAVKADESFELRTLLGYLSSIEVVPHLYHILSTVVRIIMEQPFVQLSRSDGIVTETRWKGIFEIVLSAYHETREERHKETEALMFQSLADYAVSLSVQQAPEHQIMVKELFKTIPLSKDQPITSRFNNLDISAFETHDFQNLSPGVLYGIVRYLPSLASIPVEPYQLLKWLAATIEIPPSEFQTAKLMPDTLLKSLLTTAASSICKMVDRQDEIRAEISSVSEFAAVVTPSLTTITSLTPGKRQVRQFLLFMFRYICSGLSRPNRHNVSMDILQDISALLHPDIQQEYAHVDLFHLLKAFSQRSQAVQISGRPIIYKAFDVSFTEDNISTSLRRLRSLDTFLMRSPHGADRTQFRRLISSFFYDSNMLECRQFSDKELEYSRNLQDPSLKIVASSICGDLFDLNSVRFSFPTSDPLFRIAASYWIAQTLWKPGVKGLSLGHLSFLERLLNLPDTGIWPKSDFALISFVIGDSITRIFSLFNRPDSSMSFANFDIFVSSCQAPSFLRLLLVLEDYGRYGRGNVIQSHLVKRMKEEGGAKRIFSLLEQLWDPILVNPSILTACFKGFSQSEDIDLLQPCLFLAISMLEIRNGHRLLVNGAIQSLLAQHHSLTSPTASQPIKRSLSQVVARQEGLRLRYSSLGDADPLESTLDESSEVSSLSSVETINDSSLGGWLHDLGSPSWIAFGPSIAWKWQLKAMKEILAEYPDTGGEC